MRGTLAAASIILLLAGCGSEPREADYVLAAEFTQAVYGTGLENTAVGAAEVERSSAYAADAICQVMSNSRAHGLLGAEPSPRDDIMLDALMSATMQTGNLTEEQALAAYAVSARHRCPGFAVLLAGYSARR